ncbi:MULTISPECIES: VOC family protein [unclassified Dokdonia]|jgi:extradiol dioxygenase family protein|uniref:VOC family protein n=1 Tax=unclassified Dokdonia TaxID=2615033 RepID=UPI0030EC9104|tara:strand:+ start:73322 stop:73738 length:417 start_codon:yes stop_codon:yes gene_type:complete
MTVRPFHLAIPVDDVEKARVFYRDILNLPEGRSSDHWVDFNFFGHQLVIHYKEKSTVDEVHNEVDGKAVPVPHFGVVLEWNQFQKFAEEIAPHVTFVIAPYTRFEGLVGEQSTMFFYDPCGNALEFKAFKDDSQIFAT